MEHADVACTDFPFPFLSTLNGNKTSPAFMVFQLDKMTQRL